MKPGLAVVLLAVAAAGCGGGRAGSGDEGGRDPIARDGGAEVAPDPADASDTSSASAPNDRPRGDVQDPSGQEPPPGQDAGPAEQDASSDPASRPPLTDTLATASGCAGVFNPGHLLDFHLAVAPADWAALTSDATNSVYFPAQFRCDDEAAIPVSVRRKRSGGSEKPGLKVDFNRTLDSGHFHGLKKLSLENGASEGTSMGERDDLVREYLAWRLMVLSGAHASRVAFARVHVNGTLLGVYVNVEQVDKRFLRHRLGDASGWLYKQSGSADDGYKTNETTPNPYAARMCFWDKNPCPAPSSEELRTSLPQRLDIPQMLRVGGINALIGNPDAPFAKDNNFYFYDWAGGGRVYLPWDLDTVMRETPGIFNGPGTMLYTNILFSTWKTDYRSLLEDLLSGPLTLQAIQSELDRALAVAGAALDADSAVQGDSVSESVAKLKTWWASRHAQVRSELGAD